MSRGEVAQPRLAARAMCCGWRMSKPSVPSGSRPTLPGRGDGRQSLLLALGVDDAPLDVVHGHRVGREEQGVVLPDELRDSRPNGPFWKTPLIPSRIWRTHFLRMIGWLTTCGMNWLQTLVSGVLCDRATLLTSPWLMFLSAPVTPAEPWSLSTGSRTSLLTRGSPAGRGATGGCGRPWGPGRGGPAPSS